MEKEPTEPHVNVAALMREFFGSDGHPVTSKELVDFKKEDPEGYEQVKKSLLDGTLTY